MEVVTPLMVRPIEYLFIPNKTEDVNLNVFDMIVRINESKTLTKHKSCNCKFKFHGRKCNSNQNWNNNKFQSEYKNFREHHVSKTDYIWNPVTCTWETGKYLGIVISGSVAVCDKIIEMTKAMSKNVNKKGNL